MILKELSRKDALKNLFIMRLQSKSTTEMKTIEMAMEALESQRTTEIIKQYNPNYSPFDNSKEYFLICKLCNHRVPDLSNFCPHCGAKIGDDAPVPDVVEKEKIDEAIKKIKASRWQTSNLASLYVNDAIDLAIFYIEEACK